MSKLVLLLCGLVCAKGDFAVISDIHYDQFYSVGSPARCVLGTSTGMNCCRNWSVPTNESYPAPPYGTPGCDSPLSLVQLLIQWISKQSLDFMVFLGDAVDHDLLRQTSEYNLVEIQTVASQFRVLPFPVFSILGNHDGFIVDNLWEDDRGLQWLQNVQSAYGWPNALGSGGYFSVIDKWNRRLLFLNSLGYDTHNLEVIMFPDSDLFNQTAWIDYQLAEARQTNQSVLIFSHFGNDVGEGSSMWNQWVSELNYDRLWFFAGHSHQDGVRLSNYTAFMIHPSVIPDSHWPEVRIYRDVNGVVLGYEQWGVNLTSLEMQFVYSSIEAYNLLDLSFASWSDFWIRKSNNVTLENLYQSFATWGI